MAKPMGPNSWGRCVCRVLGTSPQQRWQLIVCGEHWPSSGACLCSPLHLIAVWQSQLEAEKWSLAASRGGRSGTIWAGRKFWSCGQLHGGGKPSWELRADGGKKVVFWSKGDGAFGAQLWFCSLCNGRQARLMIMGLSLMKNMGYSALLRNQVQNYNVLRKACLWRFANEKQIKQKGQLHSMSCCSCVNNVKT